MAIFPTPACPYPYRGVYEGGVKLFLMPDAGERGARSRATTACHAVSERRAR